MKPLADESDQDIADGNGRIGIHDGSTGIDFILPVELRSKTVTEIYEDTNYVPGGQSDEDGQQVFPEANPVGEEHENIPALYGLLFYMLEHTAFGNCDAQQQKTDAQRAPDLITQAPVLRVVKGEICCHSPEQAEPRDQ